MKCELDFIKGHMGGNEIVLLYGEQIPKGRELKIALLTLEAPYIRGHEVGILYNPEGKGDINVKIIGFSSRRFITACGGMTQVLGKAIVETEIAKHFGITINEPITEVMLETDGGLVPLKIEVKNGKCKKVWTNMKSFVEECYSLGVHNINIGNVNCMRVGKFLVVNSDEVKQVYSDFNPKAMDERSLNILVELQKEFNRQKFLEFESADFALYDLHPKHKGNARAVFPHGIPRGHIEPSCGTGSVAIGIAMLEHDEIQTSNDSAKLLLETGGDITLGGPEISELLMEVKDGKVVDAFFSHNMVEILAVGKIYV